MTASPWEGKRVLVTGGAGVIGRELLQSLDRAGAEVLCCDLKPRPRWLPATAEYIQADAITLRTERIERFAPDTCFHLAATFERTEESPGFWHENFHHNVAVSHQLIAELANVSTLRRLVFASSYLVYDPRTYLFDAPPSGPTVLSEETVIRPRNLCGAAKLMHEEELRFLNEHEGVGFSAVSARIFRVYGRGSKDVISRWVRALVREQSELEVFRTEGTFDYVYASDVADGLLHLATADATGHVNLGSGRSRQVAEVLEILRSHFPQLSTRDLATESPYEAHQASVERLHALTGWMPTTGLELGIDRIVEFERSTMRDAVDVAGGGVAP